MCMTPAIFRNTKDLQKTLNYVIAIIMPYHIICSVSVTYAIIILDYAHAGDVTNFGDHQKLANWSHALFEHAPIVLPNYISIGHNYGLYKYIGGDFQPPIIEAHMHGG